MRVNPCLMEEGKESKLDESSFASIGKLIQPKDENAEVMYI